MEKVTQGLLKRKLILLYLLNVSDLFFTYILLDSKLFFEGNAFMASVINNKYLSIFLKCILVLVLIIFICFRMKNATLKQIKIANILINIILIIYFIINISHILGIAFVINL